MLEAALRLARMGLAVHWLRPPDDPDPGAAGKAPIGKKWEDRAALREAELRRQYRPGRNVGIHTGRVLGARCQVVAVDCDSAEAARWCARRLPLTPIRSQTRQGWHLYYRRPATSERIPNRGKVGGMALDVRADEGNIVAPPSVHPTGFVYAERELWTPEALDRMPFYDPAWMPQNDFGGSGGVYLFRSQALKRWLADDHGRIAAARRALAKMRPSVAAGEDGGESRLWTAALTLAARFLLDEGQIADLLITEYLPRCSKSWPLWRVLRKAREAANSRAAAAARGGRA